MSEKKCACATLERLEGASAPAYVSAFLEADGAALAGGKSLYRCKVCGREWERRAPEGSGKRATLVRLN